MEVSNMKNMVVLKNLPSNIVEEAFVILKANKKVKNLEKVENNRKNKTDELNKENKDYMFKEAEMIVANCISKMEKKEHIVIKDNRENKKIKKLKTIAFFSTLIAIVEGLLLIS